MTEQIAQTIFEGLDCKGVYILVEAEHTCMTMRGVKKPGTKIVTTGIRGIFEEDTLRRIEVLNLMNKNSGEING